ncbi:MAG: bifunctional phosphoribosylaminoimidazolecarboxamide formyltransferase/IMP cyclohydrolase [Bacteroidales bacterium]|jgi:phosphoribosylaminoimidazolecarboxamide formyltransferase/IMP cyclohydrolase|nr:bifunctional phosphoribosylaminoimidazolecarboxamide formyltransferase/IMP cyclohydrolase [Bacteroidales bacterium]MDD4215330.1 bifunctional phosphoribosylaminoimidazolecarboxamide formyltransferase/IMP cyclohydrolase [Bacteroidales bacterium]
MKKITSALISVYHKAGLDNIIKILTKSGITIYSTGGTLDYIRKFCPDAIAVETLTGFPSLFGGRVKTLHPKVFGGILFQRDDEQDIKHAEDFNIPPIDIVIVDLYPFEKTLASRASKNEIIENIDIGGISLIRAAAKNYKDVVVISSSEQYSKLEQLLTEKNCHTELEDRKYFAAQAFHTSSHYDTVIFNYFNADKIISTFNQNHTNSIKLRYGENPHQQGVFYGNISEVFEQLHGKEISYNNLVDINAAINLLNDFQETTFAILKHTNACGVSSRENLTDAWKKALAGDPASAFGGVLATNRIIHAETAEEINKIFFEVLIAPDYHPQALEILFQKKNRIILKLKNLSFPSKQYKSLLNGVIEQDKDDKVETTDDLKVVTNTSPLPHELDDLLFANKIAKHTKSNTIVLAKNRQLLGNGTGQTSRVDALRQAIIKAKEFDKDLQGAVMASDAFFPFADCVEIAHKEGIRAVIQPGGSVRDSESIEYCNKNSISMVFTGIRHFKH